VYERKPGWGVFLLRLAVACTAMVAFLVAGLYFGPDFTAVPVASRIAWLGALVGGGALVYGAAMLAMGFRPGDLKEH